MRAVRYEAFGPADVLQVVDVDIPPVKPDEALVRVVAAGVGGAEPSIRAGKLQAVMPLRPPSGVGNDFTGHVAAAGDAVERFREGDPVWGLMPHMSFGSTAEYVAVPQSRLALAPRNVGLVEAAALPVPGTTVLTALTEKVQLREGQRLLVRGASGGVGNVAVQVGRALGAHVTALVSDRNIDWVRELGAHEAVDYRKASPAELGLFDVVFDLVGTDLEAYGATLSPEGQMIALAIDPDHLAEITAFLTESPLARSGRVVSFSNNPSAERIAEVTSYVESGALRPAVDTVYPMEAAREAHQRLDAGGVRGKLIIEVS